MDIQGASNEIASLNEKIARLELALTQIEDRNLRVEIEKRWETSLARFICISIITYITMNLILWTIGGPFPPIHAIIPTCGYMLSTLSLPRVKRWWKAKIRKPGPRESCSLL